MAQAEVYNRIFDYPPTDVAGLVITDPEEIEKGAKSREIAVECPRIFSTDLGDLIWNKTTGKRPAPVIPRYLSPLKKGDFHGFQAVLGGYLPARTDFP